MIRAKLVAAAADARDVRLRDCAGSEEEYWVW